MAYMDQSEIKFKAILKQIFGENLNKEYKLTGRQLLIGRSPKCQIQISSPSISRRHCVLTRTKNGWSLKDSKSQNGTYINGRQLKPDEEYLLQCGDILFLGPPSELPQAFSYEELMGNDSDDDILELPQKRACEENTEISSKKTTLNIPFFSNCETSKKQSSPSVVSVLSDSPIKIVPRAPKKGRQQKRIEPAPATSKNPSDNSNFSSSMANIAASSESKNDLIEMNIDNVEQFYEISSTNNDEYDNSESLLHTDFQDSHDDNVEVFESTEKAGSTEKAEKEKELELKLALLSEEVKTLQASKLELLKDYKVVCEKNKVLDKELVDKQKKMEKELQMHEVKAKNEVKSELLQKFEEDLVCNICTELFIKPTVLDCSHTFCEFCIKEWRKKKNDCPICRCKIKNTTQVRTLEQFIDKTLATLTPDQKLKRANVIAERNLAERPPPVPPGARVTPRRRRGSHRHRNLRHHRVGSNLGDSSIQVLQESVRPDFSHTIYHLAPGRTENSLLDLASMGIRVFIG